MKKKKDRIQVINVFVELTHVTNQEKKRFKKKKASNVA